MIRCRIASTFSSGVCPHETPLDTELGINGISARPDRGRDGKMGLPSHQHLGRVPISCENTGETFDQFPLQISAYAVPYLSNQPCVRNRIIVASHLVADQAGDDSGPERCVKDMFLGTSGPSLGTLASVPRDGLRCLYGR